MNPPPATLSADRDHELLSINTPLDEQELVKMVSRYNNLYFQWLFTNLNDRQLVMTNF